MIEIIYEKSEGTPLKGTMRIIGREIFLLSTNNPHITQLIENLKARNAEITPDKKNKWIKIDLFKNQQTTHFKLGGVEFDTAYSPEEEIEQILADFYYLNFRKQGFSCSINHG